CSAFLHLRVRGPVPISTPVRVQIPLARRVDMNKAMAMCRGAAAGAGLMYLFDPRQGARRRALLRDALTRLSNETCHAADVAARDLSNRWQGMKSEISSFFSGDKQQVGDDQ